MKKLIPALCLLLCAALLFPMTAFAVDADAEPEADVYAVLSLSGGTELVVDDAPDPLLMTGTDGYELYVDDAPVLTVGSRSLDDPVGGEPVQYFSVNFTIPGTTDEVFLTGLRAEYVDEIQQTIIDSYADGADFNLSDMGFIDTEKTYDEDEDDNLCWAASTADMLTYTGWAAQAGFSDVDDVFEQFVGAFQDAGSSHSLALAWFFNRSAPWGNDGFDEETGDGLAKILDYPYSGGFLNDYAYEQLYVSDNSFSADKMDTAAGLLRDGWAVGMGVQISYPDEEELSGHAVTLWGYVIDRSRDSSDAERYKSIFITDSDSDELEQDDRRHSPDVMNVYSLYTTGSTAGTIYAFTYGDDVWAYFSQYAALMPYSEDLPKETSPDASKDKTADPDLMVKALFISDADTAGEVKTVYEQTDSLKLYLTFQHQNVGDADYSGLVARKLTLTDAGGSVQNFSMSNVSYTGYQPMSIIKQSKKTLTLNNLPAGDYTLTYTIDPEHVNGEAFYYNNTKSLTLKIRDSYLLGDYNGSGAVDIMDATLIQRTLVSLPVIVPDNADRRGDVTGGGLDIMDATQIQRFLVELPTTASIGAKLLYD